MLSWGTARTATLGFALLMGPALVSGCVGANASREHPGLIPVSTQPDDPARAYYVTAIDYHFHDAHPTPPLDPDRTIVVTNDGRVVHNVTIPGTNFSKDVKPGDHVVMRDIGSLFGGSGVHVFICRYHVNLGMRGTVVIAGT
jgi:hypothetical protein